MATKSARKLREQRRKRRQQYLDRKLAGECVACGVGMMQDADSVTCVDCRVVKSEATQRWIAKHPAKMRKIRQRWRRNNRKHLRRAQKRFYDQHKADGLCTKCTEPALDNHNCCAKHAHKRRLETKHSKRRRSKNPETRRRARPRKRRLQTWTKQTELHPSIIRLEMRPTEILESMRYRILSAIRWRDWSQLAEIIEAAEIGTWETDRKRYDCAQQMIGRLAKAGRLERRPFFSNFFEYRITAAGIAELEEMRAETRIAA